MAVQNSKKIQVVIVGAGFGGVRTALELSARNIPGLSITLISDKPNFEYNPALYRYATGSSLVEVCIPLAYIFAKKKVQIIIDKIASLDKAVSQVKGESGSTYPYDHLILALGSETTYFGIPGLKEHSFGMKTVDEALRLKEQVTKTLFACKDDAVDKTSQMRDANFVVVGAGATGVELAGQLISYARAVAKTIGLDPSLVSVDMIEAAPKILPLLPAKFTDPIEAHLRGLGINIFLNHAIERQEAEDVYIKDIQMKTRTLIWTAGARANACYEAWGLTVDRRGRVEVDATLHAKGEPQIFVIGDGAITKYSGYAQTAFYDGAFVARAIAASTRGTRMPVYMPKPPVNVIPAGEGWAAGLLPMFGINFRFYGRLGWFMRRMGDLRSFTIVLPLASAIRVFWKGCFDPICNICVIEEVHTHDK